MDALFSVYPLSYFEILCAIASGTLIGLERQIMGKPAGMRTSALICLSTYVFVAINRMYGLEVVRIIGQIVTGVGFLGGGVIISREGMVQGMTSAACIWVLAAIGATIGVGHPLTGIKITAITLFIIVGMDVLERYYRALRKGVHRKFKHVEGSELQE
jgi:putative Mg2+ transporter-C (MgtC) family protein